VRPDIGNVPQQVRQSAELPGVSAYSGRRLDHGLSGFERPERRRKSVWRGWATMIRQDRIVIEARSWIGTPYRHQASTKGAGADCLGLLRGIWRAIFGREPAAIPPYSSDWSEVSGEEALLAAARTWLVELHTSGERPGDILLFRMRNGCVAKHLGVAARAGAAPSFIHAYTGHGVIESPLSEPWQRKVIARFQFPEIAPGT
jgi:NlpC/P60 family putative phage cell wall peptidase